jgi:type IV secretion system protein VirD4
MTSSSRAVVGFLVLVPLVLLTGLPGAVYMIHGFGIWPPAAGKFVTSWWQAISHFDVLAIVQILWEVLRGRSEIFAGQGSQILAILTVLTAVIILAYALLAPAINRKVLDGQLGDARFATDEELAKARRGIEIGLSPRGGRPVRLPLEGNAISFAPPRTGKTSGLILPNLVSAEAGSWFGPVIVIDPKGDLYRMTAERRRSLGRKVVCLDPYNLAGGTDRWNPFVGVPASQASTISRMIGALLVETGDSNLYFRQRATMALRGAITALLLEGPTTPAEVRDLFIDRAALLHLISESANSSVRALRELLAMDEKVWAPIMSTAETAFDWLQDEAMVDVSSDSTFTLEEVARGHADLFIVVPTDLGETLAPWLRLAVSELFAAARRHRHPGDERIVAFVDEAAVLRRFGQLSEALGELPGYGISLWTFWQTRGQIEQHYGKPGLGIFLGTAEITTVSDLSPTLVDEALDWSAAVGSRTEAVSTVSQSGKDGKSGTSQAPQRVPLMQPEAVTSMDADDLLAFIRVRGKRRRPALLKKVRPHTEPRFKNTYKRATVSPVISG